MDKEFRIKLTVQEATKLISELALQIHNRESVKCKMYNEDLCEYIYIYVEDEWPWNPLSEEAEAFYEKNNNKIKQTYNIK